MLLDTLRCFWSILQQIWFRARNRSRLEDYSSFEGLLKTCRVRIAAMECLFKRRTSKTLNLQVTVLPAQDGKQKDAADGKQKEMWYINDPADVEGLLVTLGVISSLIFANIVSLQCSVGSTEMARGDFQFLLRGNPEFRQFAKTVWKEEGLSFEARIGVGPDEVFDIRTVLDNPSGDILEWSTHESREFATTFQYMEADFPKAKMQVWKTWRGVRTGEHGGSDYLTTTGTLAYVFAALSLFNSVTMYVSFAYSPAKEDYDRETAKDQKDEPQLPPLSLVKWTKIGMPVILFSYLMLLTGCCCFCFSTSSVNHIRYLYTTQAWFSQRVQYFFLIPTVVVFTFVVPIWAFVVSSTPVV